MSERKPIMCGPLSLEWRRGDWAVDNVTPAKLGLNIMEDESNGTFWAGVWDASDQEIESWPGRSSPELAAADLAKFLGEMAEALEPWRQTWQPIETAPKDGTLVLVADDDGPEWSMPAQWCRSLWVNTARGIVPDPTHWMPIPSPPEKP